MHDFYDYMTCSTKKVHIIIMCPEEKAAAWSQENRMKNSKLCFPMPLQ